MNSSPLDAVSILTKGYVKIQICSTAMLSVRERKMAVKYCETLEEVFNNIHAHEIETTTTYVTGTTDKNFGKFRKNIRILVEIHVYENNFRTVMLCQLCDINVNGR